MKFCSISILLAIAFIGNAKANPQQEEETTEPCLADCVVGGSGDLECTFEVRRDELASELGYFEFRGAGGVNCGSTNPTLGIMKGVTYFFKQPSTGNYFHPIGFAYYPDGALDDQPELEPGIAPPGSGSDCGLTLSCPAPMYISDGVYLGKYSNNADIAPVNGDEDFGLDAYEPQFKYPLLDWKSRGTYKVGLKFDDNVFEDDFFYFCHVHKFMSGRIKFLDGNGKDSLRPKNDPIIPYKYQQPDAYDRSCGATGISAYQLPNDQCPSKFVCESMEDEKPSVKKFAECIDTMNCAMITGMTTKVNKGSAIALFNHQMIPHHQQAINMCKALDIEGSTECDDIFTEEPQCLLKVLCQEIINVQNAQIQTMRGILSALDLDQTDDCVVPIAKSAKSKKSKSRKSAKGIKRD